MTISPTGGGGSDEARKVVGGWKNMTSGKSQSRRERLAEERKRGPEIDPENVTADQKKQAMIEARDLAENEDENPIRHLKESYKAMRKKEQSKRRMKVAPDKLALLLCEITEKGGVICEVREAGFNIFEAVYIL